MEFQYTTIQRLRDEGLSVTDVPDARALELIKDMSDFINLLTDQWFQPVEATYYLDGKGDDILHVPNLIPIIKLTTLSLDDTAIDADTYVVKERLIEKISSTFSMPIMESNNLGDLEIRKKGFTAGVGNYEALGVYGWLASNKDISTTTTTDIEASDTEVELDSVDGIEVRDTVIIGDDSLYVIVETVDIVNSKITFQSVGTITTISSGAAVRCYGATPRMIERACIRLIVQSKMGLAETRSLKAEIRSRIKSERTDNYRYELFPLAGEGAYGGITGISRVDAILDHYSKPVVYVGAV